MATPYLLKITAFWNKGYDIKILVYDVIITNLSSQSNYIVNVVMLPKFGNCSISTTEAIITLILSGFDQKKIFFEGWFWFKFNNLELLLGMALKIHNNLAKGLKLKVRKFWGLTLTFGDGTGEKLVGGLFTPSILDKVNKIFSLIIFHLFASRRHFMRHHKTYLFIPEST